MSTWMFGTIAAHRTWMQKKPSPIPLRLITRIVGIVRSCKESHEDQAMGYKGKHHLFARVSHWFPRTIAKEQYGWWKKIYGSTMYLRPLDTWDNAGEMYHQTQSIMILCWTSWNVSTWVSNMVNVARSSIPYRKSRHSGYVNPFNSYRWWCDHSLL